MKKIIVSLVIDEIINSIDELPKIGAVKYDESIDVCYKTLDVFLVDGLHPDYDIYFEKVFVSGNSEIIACSFILVNIYGIKKETI